MTLTFQKYHGTGNDFVMISQAHNASFYPNIEDIRRLCSRHFGIGADGLILIKKHKEFDFEVDYFNADGSKSFCGNGARCSVEFARNLGLFQNSCSFLAIDGHHEAYYSENGNVVLKMGDVNQIEQFSEEPNDYILDTGSPHYVRFCSHKNEFDIVELGKKIRYSDRFKSTGINVNTVCSENDHLYVQTYERGVEGETFSCGTGVTAVALASALQSSATNGSTKILTKGGELIVHWEKKNNGFERIFLEGPAQKVYEGSIEL